MKPYIVFYTQEKTERKEHKIPCEKLVYLRHHSDKELELCYVDKDGNDSFLYPVLENETDCIIQFDMLQ